MPCAIIFIPSVSGVPALVASVVVADVLVVDRRVPALSGVPDVACDSAVAVVPKYTVAGVPAIDDVPFVVGV